MSAVVMLELDHEKVLANGAVASKMVPVETRHLVQYNRAGRGRRAAAGGGLRHGASAHRIGRRWVRMTTFKPWEYRADAGFVKGTDLTGYTVVAVDGDLGHVEAEYDSRPAYLEVDVGSWLFGHEVMVPAGLVERIDTTEGKVYVDRTKGQIEDAPRYDKAVTDHVDYRERLGSYYAGTYMPPGGQT
jgi:hypothetical protein